MSFDKWMEDNCYETIWVDHDLNTDSVVVEFGGYLGRWSKEIHYRYNPNLWIFEPVTEFYEEIKGYFSKLNNDKVRIINEGLSLTDEEKTIYISKDSTSVIKNPEFPNSNYNERLVKFMSVDKILELTGKVNLCQINIEGFEYELLDYLLVSGKIFHFEKLIIEFHYERIEEFVERRKKIQTSLKINGYKQIWNYDWVFECWEKIKN